MLPHEARACSKPCKGCPFRRGGFIVPNFPKRYQNELKGGSFVCHQTKDLPNEKRLQCAGFVIFSDKIGEPCLSQTFAQRLFKSPIEYAPDAQGQVFDDVAEFNNHHQILKK